MSHLETSSLPLDHLFSLVPTPVTRTLIDMWAIGICIQFRRTLGSLWKIVSVKTLRLGSSSDTCRVSANNLQAHDGPKAEQEPYRIAIAEKRKALR